MNEFVTYETSGLKNSGLRGENLIKTPYGTFSFNVI